MTKLRSSLMEVTGALAHRARAAHFNFGNDTALVAVQHMLWQTIDLFEAIAALGVKRENIFALGKVYSNSPTVIAALQSRGFTVVESSLAKPGEFDAAFRADVDQLWEVVRQALAQRRVRRILVLDDGGMCATRITRELLARYTVAGVEQTSFGILLFEQTPPPFAMISWARSAVKLQIGGPLFSQCLLAKLQSRFLRGRRLTRQQVGIIGLGSIGSALANFAERQHNDVFFYDSDPAYEAPPYLHARVTRVDSLEDLLSRSDYVFGCSGREPFKDRWPVRHRPGIKLFSASGGDHEFGAIINDLKNHDDFSIAPATLDINCDGPCGPMAIAYLGYPYNFVARDVEAVPTRVVQIETGGLLAGLIQARTHLRFCDDGRARNEGVQRISPDSQRFIYEVWLKTMKRKQIDLSRVYGYDAELLDTPLDRFWFTRNSEPTPSRMSEPNWLAEAALARLIDGRGSSRLGSERKFQPDRCTL